MIRASSQILSLSKAIAHLGLLRCAKNDAKWKEETNLKIFLDTLFVAGLSFTRRHWSRKTPDHSQCPTSRYLKIV